MVFRLVNTPVNEQDFDEKVNFIIEISKFNRNERTS